MQPKRASSGRGPQFFDHLGARLVTCAVSLPVMGTGAMGTGTSAVQAGPIAPTELGQ